ncbi:MAG: glycoside hydrolase family 32 protein [Armatimonadota bacterium]
MPRTLDPHRPRYHFLPPAEWMNDPNGPIFWRGEYHLFYQYGPLPENWDLKYWGHAVSGDLVHWRELPIALEPTPGGPDKDGVWSGCAVDDGGVLTLIYTGVFPEVQCVAASRDGVTFEKYAGNPVIAGPPEGMQVTGFRDPCAWREDDGWYLVIGSGITDVGGAVLLYRSQDLRQWEYLHPLCVGKQEETGAMWECPDFFPLDNRHVLFFSPYGLPTYLTGGYADHRFTPRAGGGKLDYGRHFYAPNSFLDGQGRRILWGWCWEGRTNEAQRAAGWAGVMSLPRVLTLDGDRLRQAPAPEVETLRGSEHLHVYETLLASRLEIKLDPIPGDAVELHVLLDPGTAREVGLSLRRSPDGEEETRLVFTRETGMLGIDRTKSSLDPAQNRGFHDGPVHLAPGEPLDLRLFIDRSLLEVFANERTCLTSRIYATRADSLGISLFAEDGAARLLSLDAWEMLDIR